MKKSIYILSSLALAAAIAFSCKEEDEFKIVGAPYIDVTAGGKQVATIDDAAQYTLDLEPNAYSAAANPAQHVVAATKFEVRSNLRWKIAPVEGEENYDWVTPFPSEGEKDGLFLFKTTRNTSQNDLREAYFNIYVDKGQGFEALPGMIVVNQAVSPDFFETSAAVFESEFTAKTLTLNIFSNVNWTYNLEPMSDYATENVEWITDGNNHIESKQVDTLKLKLAANSGAIRGANLNLRFRFSGMEKDSLIVIPITQYGEKEVSVEGFPVQWIIGVGNTADKINFLDTFPKDGYIDAVTGSGKIFYISDPAKVDPDNKFARVVGGGGDPYVTGAWPGDYWEFRTDSPVAAGTILRISFQAATSATGHKFWRLEYKDGDKWLVPASLRQTTDEPGSEIVYTHAMKTSSSDKVDVSAVVKLENTTDYADFRFVCAANWKSEGGALAKPNGGTMRLSLANTASDEWQPTIKCIAAGSEVITTADITVSGLEDGVLTFEGTPAASKTIKVTSSADFSVSSNVSWLSFGSNSGVADTPVDIEVICEPSTSTEMRKGQIDIVSGVTHKYITVIQSAAGGELDPLISVVTDKSTSALLGEGDSFDVTVQSNIDYQLEISDSWITEAEVPSTRGLVEKSYHSFTLAANLTGATRSGYVRFYNEDKNIEAYVMIKQDNFEPRIDVSAPYTYLGVSGLGGVVNYNIDANVDFTVAVEGSWLTLPAAEGQKGTYQIPVTFEANTGEARSTTVTFKNEAYGYTKTVTVRQFATGIIFADDFSWLQPVIDAAKATDPGDYDTVGNKNLSAKAPNIYATAALNEIFAPLRDAIGYYIPGKADGANNVVYPQECYLKMGKTKSSSQTSITLPPVDPAGKDINVNFKWARMVQGSGTIDDYTLTLVIKGNGSFENGTKYSDELSTPQGKNEIFWTDFSVKVIGADKDTRITLLATALLNKETGAIDYTKTGGKRIFLDDIVIAPAK
ncbi:MAG: BACON domain-containing protein [Bacteroidales bacterium]|nr:BACON domain-containing protein [Bacteroidales bacterium]MDY2860207.1 BACON domain-containing protein [Candidatus Cryptobacteroides sp.]MDY5442936.1 BACON domain-containing protein [Candidatus Cryptobacteroides sp.]